MSSGYRTAAFAAATTLLMSGAASAGEPATLAAAGRDVPPPMGLIELCGRSPEICLRPGLDRADLASQLSRSRRSAWAEILSGKRRAIGPSAFEFARATTLTGRSAGSQAFLGGLAPHGHDPVGWDTIVAINTRVNRAIRATSDARLYGQADVWALPSTRSDGLRAGDCEDIVLAKRDALIRAGVHPERLSIALARTPAGEDHAVLLVARTDGDYVLDNLDSRVLHWTDADLHWQSRHRPGDLLAWIALDEG